jgi:hypothetical protein
MNSPRTMWSILTTFRASAQGYQLMCYDQDGTLDAVSVGRSHHEKKRRSGYRQAVLRWRSQFSLEPTHRFKGFHLIHQLDHELMDQTASRTFECPDVKARRSGGDTCQHHCCLALRARWSMNDHDARLGSGGSATLSVTGSCREQER